MPIYEYKCKKCNHIFEQLQKISDKPLCTCPECGAKQLIKLISNTSFQLKGTGWYETDFKTKKEKNSGHSNKPKTEAKPIEKSKSTASTD